MPARFAMKPGNSFSSLKNEDNTGDDVDENREEKPVGNEKTIDASKTRRESPGDLADTAGSNAEENLSNLSDDFEYENEETGLFDNKINSIFIRSTPFTSIEELSSRREKLEEIDGGETLVENAKKPRRLEKKRAISFIDTLLSLFVVGPLVIGQWRGIWNMMDIYNKFFPEWLCFLLGISLHILFAIGRDCLHGRFVEKLRMNHGTGGRIAYDLVRLLYIYVFCVACNAHWRGGWGIFSYYCADNIWISTLFTIIFAGGLIALRSFRNLLAPPFIIVIDCPDRVFRFPTRYNVVSVTHSLKRSFQKFHDQSQVPKL